MKTRITELFGIQHPIIQGGMHFVGLPELASAVSNAGGLGMITALTLGTPEKLAAAIKRCHEMTDKPFGVNLTFLPTFANPPYAELIQAIVEGGVRIVETAGRSPEEYMPLLKQHGIKVIHKCTSVRHSLKAERIGCDAVSVDGFECGGHPGEDDVPNFILLPLAAEALKIPFVASGGMADGRSLVAALALGAEGMNMGTRFIATQEAPVHENVKQALVRATELDTRLIMRSLRNTERVLRNTAVDKVVEIEKQKGAATTIDDIREYVAGAYTKVMQQGDMEAGAWSCGMVAGLVHDVPTCRELIDRIMAEADAIIAQRLGRACALPDRLDFAALRELRDVIARPEGERLDRHRRLPAPRRHHARAVADEQVADVVRPVVLVDDRRLRVVAHARRSQQVRPAGRLGDWRLPDFERAGRLHGFDAAILQVTRHRQVVRVVLVGHAQRGQAPGILQFRIEVDAIGLERQRRAVSGDDHRARQGFQQ